MLYRIAQTDYKIKYRTERKKTMTTIPVFDAVLVPGIKLYIKKDIFEAASGHEPRTGEQVLLLPEKTATERKDLSPDDFYPIGISGVVSNPDANGHAVVRTSSRVNIEDITIQTDGTISVRTTDRPEIGDLSSSAQKEHLEKLQAAISDFLSQVEWGPMVRQYMLQWSSVAEITAGLSGRLMISSSEKYDILAEDSLAKRYELMERAVYEFLEMARISSDAQNAQQEDHQKLYRESAIKKQMEYLQNELDEMHPENVSDERKLQQRIEECGIYGEAREEALKVLTRMKQNGSSSPEYGMLYDYLDFLTSLPWKTPERPPIDLNKAGRILEEDHFGLKKVKHRILQQIAVMNLRKKQSGSILLFVGAPGTGKTSIGQSIAKALGREYVRVSLGGVRDEAEIRGHRRTYIGAMPGRIIDGIRRCGSPDPVMVLDEVDKLAASYNGDPASALLEVLDPEQNNTFTDHYMNVPYDLSNVVFLCTANSTDTIPEPLLNRMEVISFQGYTQSEKFQIARRHLLPKSMEAMGLKKGQLALTDEALSSLISDYTMEGGVRGLKKCVDTLCREAAVRLHAENTDGSEASPAPDSTVLLQKEDLQSWLDRRPVRHEQALSQQRSGIVTGMAWTSAGGEILLIETLFAKGNGNTIITGQLGDVMKESAQIAVSLVKSLYPEKADLFSGNDLHIHVPAGAVPKDGPSAGITLTTAIASLVTQKSVSPRIAMTGEISLRGTVMPIGGLPEKLMAAVRAGIETVLIPEDNLQDLEDVPEEIKEHLEIIPVKTIGEVLEKTGITDPPGKTSAA